MTIKDHFTEKGFGDSIAEKLDSLKVWYVREKAINSGMRPDFVIGTFAVELKLECTSQSIASAIGQASLYSACGYRAVILLPDHCIVEDYQVKAARQSGLEIVLESDLRGWLESRNLVGSTNGLKVETVNAPFLKSYVHNGKKGRFRSTARFIVDLNGVASVMRRT